MSEIVKVYGITLILLQILTVQICKSRRFYIFMKATGIVRRIEECVIIGQKSKNRINTGVSAVSDWT